VEREEKRKKWRVGFVKSIDENTMVFKDHNVLFI